MAYEPASTNEEIRTWKPGDLLRLQNTENSNRRGETYELLSIGRERDTLIYISARHIKTGEISELRRADRFVKV